MNRLEKIKESLAELSYAELGALAVYISERQEDLWDEQIERDAIAGKFDAMFQEAIRDHAEGRTLPLFDVLDGRKSKPDGTR